MREMEDTVDYEIVIHNKFCPNSPRKITSSTLLYFLASFYLWLSVIC